ncbi:hypothetical protein [Agaribacterium haliotis]|uniref:hypothetical protein n=1 Tax=Agaribacterium haliotis TaxID=2013869 RepID=UPI000BB543E1|nr:hypothetical protein [Agaribacterium haliotis]
MKSDKAATKDVKTDTYCRHGFHEWVEVELEGHEDKADENGKVWQCKNCARFKNSANESS